MDHWQLHQPLCRHIPCIHLSSIVASVAAVAGTTAWLGDWHAQRSCLTLSSFCRHAAVACAFCRAPHLPRNLRAWACQRCWLCGRLRLLRPSHCQAHHLAARQGNCPACYAVQKLRVCAEWCTGTILHLPAQASRVQNTFVSAKGRYCGTPV